MFEPKPLYARLTPEALAILLSNKEEYPGSVNYLLEQLQNEVTISNLKYGDVISLVTFCTDDSVPVSANISSQIWKLFIES